MSYALTIRDVERIQAIASRIQRTRLITMQILSGRTLLDCGVERIDRREVEADALLAHSVVFEVNPVAVLCRKCRELGMAYLDNLVADLNIRRLLMQPNGDILRLSQRTNH